MAVQPSRGDASPVRHHDPAPSCSESLCDVISKIVTVIRCLAIPLIIVGALGWGGKIPMSSQAYFTILGLGLAGACLWCCGNSHYQSQQRRLAERASRAVPPPIAAQPQLVS